ncbi:MAG: DNA alkylation repair protein [Blautia sp.]|nr:DNA alkylation repair protein [Blautia sp.]
MSDICSEIRAKLFEIRDEEYKAFHAKLIPTVPEEAIIGVRTPVLRKYAREMAKDPRIGEFLGAVPHQYYDENNLHGFLIEQDKDYEKCLAAVESFLPYIDNWATCDMLAPKVFGRHTGELLEPVRRWIASEETYTVRFAMNMLMRFYLDEKFRQEYLEMVSAVKSEEYYVNMMIAWYFATALAKQYDAALPYLEQRKLSPWTHNKTIQKACESYRITAEQKAYLRGLKEKVR